MKKYKEIRSSLKTGDLVLFSGRGIASAAIKIFTMSKYSHVGMVVHIPEWDIVMCLESTTMNNTADVDVGVPVQGVSLVPLSTRVNKYDGHVWISRLKSPLSKTAISEVIKARHEFNGKPYEESKIELIKSAWDGPFGHNDADLSSLFCSELIAEIYQRIGLLLKDTPSNEFKPKDLSPDGAVRHLIKDTIRVK